MATAWVECWKCEACAHRWIKGELYPAQCGKCRSRKWNESAGKDILDQAIDRAPVGAIAVHLATADGTIVETRPVPNMQALRETCAGRIVREIDLGMKQVPGEVAQVEIPTCGKRWWEEGTHYECIMEAGHRDRKHGLRGMVQRLED